MLVLSLLILIAILLGYSHVTGKEPVSLRTALCGAPGQAQASDCPPELAELESSPKTAPSSLNGKDRSQTEPVNATGRCPH